jgi:hypothetical protein
METKEAVDESAQVLGWRLDRLLAISGICFTGD